ncbi:MAG: hypothetical protein QM492_07095 [Rhodobacterales bacterium]
MMKGYHEAVLNGMAITYGLSKTEAISDGWKTAVGKNKAMIQDLAVLGHLYEPDFDEETGKVLPHDELVVRAARKAFALQLLARAEVSQDDLAQLRNEDLYNETE